MKRATFYHPTVAMELTMRISEEEARAIYALTQYGIEPFIKEFRDRMGSTLSPHVEGLRSLLASIKADVPGLLKKANEAREAFRP